MMDTSVASEKVVRSLTNGILDQDVLGFPIFYLLIAVALVLVIVALGITTLREKRRRKLVEQLQTKKRAMDQATKDMFTARKADEIKEAVADPGKPQTRISEGSVAYTETGEMIVFKSSSAIRPGDAMAAAVTSAEEAKVSVQMPPTWSASYRIERIIALHITGVVMFSVDSMGRIEDGRRLNPDLIVVLEGLVEEARWLGGEMVKRVYKNKTVCLSWGGDIHMAAVLDGEPDERLDRELRWAIGDLVDEFSEEIWSWDNDTDSVTIRTLTSRISEVFALTDKVDLGIEAVTSPDGGLRITSTVAWRNSLAEYILGITNLGPGSVFDVELLPTLSKEGLLEVVTVDGVEVDKKMRFVIPEVPEGDKAVATFYFRALKPLTVRVDCIVVFLKGVANIKNVKLLGRWIELERAEIHKGEHVEPERALELATQPATFRDRAAFFIPRSMDPVKLFNDSIEKLAEDFSPVVELEDDDGTQLEAWFHAEVVGGGTVVASLTAVPNKGIVDIFAASTIAGIVPGTMVQLRNALDRAARQILPGVIDPELRSTVPRMGVLLFESWGTIDED